MEAEVTNSSRTGPLVISTLWQLYWTNRSAQLSTELGSAVGKGYFRDEVFFFKIISSHKSRTRLVIVTSYLLLRKLIIDTFPSHYFILKFHFDLLRFLFTSLRGLFYFFLQFQHKFLFAQKGLLCLNQFFYYSF